MPAELCFTPALLEALPPRLVIRLGLIVLMPAELCFTPALLEALSILVRLPSETAPPSLRPCCFARTGP